MTAVTLYRCPTPTDRLCPCGDAARALARHDVTFETVRVARKRGDRPEVEALSGQPRVPLVVFEDGETICDSRRIKEHLRWRNKGV